MNCHEALDHLYELLDRELTAELEAAVKDHLETCKQCFPLYRFESGFHRFLRARVEAPAAPPDLRRAVLDRIMHEPEA